MRNPGYTPFGYLQNPFYQCRDEYLDITGGALKSDPVSPAFGWNYPYVRRTHFAVSAGFGFVVDGRTLLTREDYAPGELHSRLNTSRRFSYDLEISDCHASWTYWLSAEDELCVRLVVRPLPAPASAAGSREMIVLPFVRAVRKDASIQVTQRGEYVDITTDAHERFELPPARWSVNVARHPEHSPTVAAGAADSLVRTLLNTSHGDPETADGISGEAWCANAVRIGIDAEPIVLDAVLTRRSSMPDFGSEAGERRESTYRAATRSDLEWAGIEPELEGAWPEHWANGFHYDFVTTRLCTMPASGIFRDVWPTWMADFARVVLGEGSMDMNRLGYASPALAKRALLTLFRDAPAPNIPCVFASGAYNMVAEDGSRCGTSPAWCVPFFQIYDLYLRTADRAWMADLYPYLVAYVEWWLEHRTDDEGWGVYTCTWEAGEDNTPRLDPGETGDNIISGFVRPVELQAAIAQSAGILAAIAESLGRERDVPRWKTVAREYEARLHTLFDHREGRFRDWDIATDAFVKVAGTPSYWNVDFTRLSPLSLVALHLDTANDEERAAMRQEVPLYDRHPFTMWASWSTFVLEAAVNLGMRRFAAETASRIVDRVYARTDRRALGGHEFPTPGASPEWWPLDLDEWGPISHDAYAWGAQTATFVIRYILGFRSSDVLDRTRFILAPAIPQTMMPSDASQTLAVASLAYRDRRISIAYGPSGDASAPTTLRVTLTIDVPAVCTVRELDDDSGTFARSARRMDSDAHGDPFEDRQVASNPVGGAHTHTFTVENCRQYEIELERPLGRLASQESSR